MLVKKDKGLGSENRMRTSMENRLKAKGKSVFAAFICVQKQRDYSNGEY